MRRELYDQYAKALNQFRAGNQVDEFNDSLLPENTKPYLSHDEIIFTCKNYKVEKGLSTKLHADSCKAENCEGNSGYIVKGLMG